MAGFEAGMNALEITSVILKIWGEMQREVSQDSYRIIIKSKSDKLLLKIKTVEIIQFWVSARKEN